MKTRETSRRAINAIRNNAYPEYDGRAIGYGVPPSYSDEAFAERLHVSEEAMKHARRTAGTLQEDEHYIIMRESRELILSYYAGATKSNSYGMYTFEPRRALATIMNKATAYKVVEFLVPEWYGWEFYVLDLEI